MFTLNQKKKKEKEGTLSCKIKNTLKKKKNYPSTLNLKKKKKKIVTKQALPKAQHKP